MIDIDTLDRKILRELQHNADQSLEDLGERVGLSRNACWRRVRILQETGVIRKRVALLDPDALGLGLSVFIQVRTANHASDWLDKFARAMRDVPEVLGAYRMTGDLDYLIHARVEDVADYDRLYQHLISKIELSDVSASFVMEEIKETTELSL